MRSFKSPYEFYKLPEEERRALIGEPFVAEERPFSLYFPFEVDVPENNYNAAQGLIWVSMMLMSKEGAWFRVAAFSPDDIDMDLDFTGAAATVEMHQRVCDFLRTLPRFPLSYEGILKAVQLHCGAGVRTS